MNGPLLLIADAVQDVVDTLGPGRRSVVWVQGCDLACPGCMVPESWSPRIGRDVDPIELARELLDGNAADLTVSGGEPTQQAAAVASLLAAARDRGRTTWVYTGRTLEDLEAAGDPEVARMLGLVDVLVDGPYVAALAGGVGYRGSRNQRILRLTSAISQAEADAGEPGRVELRTAMDGLTLIGVPEPGLIDALRNGLSSRGVETRSRRPGGPGL